MLQGTSLNVLHSLPATPPAPAEAEKAAAPAAAAAGPEEWAQFGEAEGEAPAVAAVPAKPVAPTLPAVTDKDVKDSLQLTEVWQAEVAGGKVLRAGLEGGVRRRLAPYGLAAARFRLLPAPSGVANACLRVAAMNRDFAEQLPQGAASSGGDGGSGGGSGCFLAKFTQASVGCCYLQYTYAGFSRVAGWHALHEEAWGGCPDYCCSLWDLAVLPRLPPPNLPTCRLPAVACQPPLQLELHVVPGADPSKPGGAGWQGLVVLRYAASPHLSGPVLDVTFDLNVPPEAASLLRVSPAAQWAREQGQLRWMLPRVAPGADGELRAVFGCKAGVAPGAATAALQRQAEARVLFSARPGRSLSGLGFQVAEAEPAAAFMPAQIQCFGEVTVRV